MADGKIKKKSININSYNYDKNDEGRMVQLSVMLYMLKNAMGEEIYTEIASSTSTHYIPYSFGMYEIIALTKTYKPLTLYAELDTDNYCEIRLEEVKISGTKDFIDKAVVCFERAQNFTSDISLFCINMKNMGNDYYWNYFFNNEYRKCIEIGDRFIKNGSMRLYPEEYEEYYVYAIDDYRGTPKEDIEYIVLYSNLSSDKFVLIDHKNRHIIAAGFDEVEQEQLLDICK